MQNAGKGFLDRCEIASFPFGVPAALLTTGRAMHLSQILGEETGSPVGVKALLALLRGRAEEPVSKNGLQSLYARRGMEEDYHVLKDGLPFPGMPSFHRLANRIQAYTFPRA